MLTFLGDVFLKTPVAIEVDLPGELVINLEAPLTDEVRGYPRKINLKAAPSNLAATFTRPPLAACLANNHILDFYRPGLESTIATLQEHGVKHFGVGPSEQRNGNPLIVEVADLKVALLGYADRSSNAVFGIDGESLVGELSLERVVADIAAARDAGAQRVVVNAHWGYEQVPLPAGKHVVLARQIVDAGADLVIGHHSHCIQGFEQHGGKPIFYGLGNCIFPSHKSPSQYNDAGKPTTVVDSLAAPWNRTSLAVSWEPRSGEVDVRPLVFNNDRLTAGRFSVKAFELNIDSLDAYAERFKRAYRWGRLRHNLARFVLRPKVPRLSHLRGVRKEMRSVPPS